MTWNWKNSQAQSLVNYLGLFPMLPSPSTLLLPSSYKYTENIALCPALFPRTPSASWVDSANMARQLCYQQHIYCQSWQDRSQTEECPETLPTHLPLWFVWCYTCSSSRGLITYTCGHASSLLGCPRHMFIRITVLSTSRLWNHNTGKGGTNTKWQECMAVLTASAIEKILGTELTN